MRVLRHISKRGAECMRGCIWVGEKGERPAGEQGGEKRVVCGCYGNAQSLSYNYMGKNGSRTFTPRYTPTALSPGSALSLPSLPLPSRWQLRFFFFCFHLAFFLRTPPRSSLPPPSASPPLPTASSTPSTSHPASPRRLIAPRHLLCPPREYYACTLPGRLCNHP